jgi:hypothetical protein
MDTLAAHHVLSWSEASREMMALRLLHFDIDIARLRLCEDGNHPTLRTGGGAFASRPAPFPLRVGVLFL